MNKSNTEIIVNKSIYDQVEITLSKASILKAISMFVLMYLVMVLANIIAFTDGRTSTNILMIVALMDVVVMVFTVGILAEIIKTKLR